MMSELKTKLVTDTWVVATWDEYIQAIENPAYEKAKGYYYDGRMRIEMSPVGNDYYQLRYLSTTNVGNRSS